MSQTDTPFEAQLKRVQLAIAAAGKAAKETRMAIGADNTHIARELSVQTTTRIHEAWDAADQAIKFYQGVKATVVERLAAARDHAPHPVPAPIPAEAPTYGD